MKHLKELIQKIKAWFENQNLKHRQQIVSHAFGWYDDEKKDKILIVCENIVIATLDKTTTVEEVEKTLEEYKQQALDYLDSKMYK